MNKSHDNDTMIVHSCLPIFTRAVSAVRAPVVKHRGRHLTPTNKMLLAVPYKKIVTRGKRKIEAFATIYVVVDMDDICMQRAAVWGGKVDKNTRTNIVGDVLWCSTSHQYYVLTSTGCSRLQEWLS